MDMNKVHYVRKEDCRADWHVIDAKDQVLGRLATKVSDILTGRNKPTFAPHTGDGDYVVIINAGRVVLTGKKLTQKIYQRFTGWMGNKKEFTAKEIMAKDPARIIEHAVKGMLPKNKLGSAALRRLRVYVDDKHPHSPSK